ncbi:unnamed protein product [Nippostrongylus brasiliensis]|uniref:Translation initiation factor eIF2B subunit delta n=1 Tax=Nippostrongylus brasiliensis TaxID=27835 RepID=A0A158QZP2_NIPBR|nr:unnamed protein product [Nippostrongylus brasiliensis]
MECVLLSIAKLTEGIQKMGDVLGAVKRDGKSAVGNHTSKVSPANSPDLKPVSAEDVKAQRANKKAEKKARSEAAAAKKAAAPAATAGTHSQGQEKPKQNSVNVKAPSDKAQVNANASQKQQASPGKSALRGNGKHPPAREVKFVSTGHCSESPDPPSTAHIHSAFLSLAVRCEQGMIDEVDSLCLNFIAAFKEYLADWTAQRQKENRDSSSVSHDLYLAIRPQIAHLTHDSRWPLPYALGNIVRQLKKEIMKIGTSSRSGHEQTVEDVQKWLDDCEEEYFGSAYRAISDYLLEKMKHSPNVITYGWCPLVNKVLHDSTEKTNGTVFTVIDSEMEGRGIHHINSFVERKIRCRYTDLNSIGAVMKSQGSIVLLGCTAVLSNGCVVAPKGSMLVALAAKSFNVPVLVLSQTFKFVDQVQGGGRVALLERESVELVPSDLITAIVTDIRVLPPSSAPAVLKAKALDLE